MQLFPEIEPYRQGYLDVPGGHSLYFEEAGNPEGRPVVFLHGGPGAGIGPKHRRYFNPAFWRVVLFDQRGAGRSRPHAGLESNTTWDLVDDIERLRSHLGIAAWSVFGGSWGSTLALAYAVKHKLRVESLMLRGIFLGSRREMLWLYQEGASRFFPEAFERYASVIPESERHDLLHAFQ
jgi:proline iminopeptidase